MPRYALFFMVVIFYTCSSPDDQTKRLDFFGDFDNTEVTFLLKGAADSLDLGIDYFQYLHARLRFDTTLTKVTDGTAITKTLTLEKPTILELTIGSTVHKIFLLPAEPATIICDIGPEEVKISFEEEQLDRINQYYARKSAVTNGLHRSDFYGPEILRTDISADQIFANFDSMKLLLNNLLEQSANELSLPDWFVEYEEKNIHYRDLGSKKGAPIIREYMGISDHRLPMATETDQQIVLNDELGLLNEDYLDLISNYMLEEFDHMKFRQLSENEKLRLLYDWGKNIDNKKIRDVYFAHHFMMMQLTSFSYADTIVNLFREGISPDLQPYLHQLEQNFAELTGKPAPAVHLKDGNDELVSLNEFRGNILLLDFWFIGCKGCKEELPYDRKLVNTFKDEPFKLIKICMKSDRAKWQDMQGELSGINLISNEAWDKKLTRSYQLKGYPRYVLVGKDGRIIDGWSKRPSDPALTKRLRQYFL